MPLPEEQRHASGRLGDAIDEAKHVPFSFSLTAMPMLNPAGPKGVSSRIWVRVGAASAARADPFVARNAARAQIASMHFRVTLHLQKGSAPSGEFDAGCGCFRSSQAARFS